MAIHRKIRSQVEDAKRIQHFENASKKGAFTMLSSVVKTGDYINYPVEYASVSNIILDTSRFTGWRVLDVKNHMVRLVSAGVPLIFNHSPRFYGIENARMLKEELLDIPIGEDENSIVRVGFKGIKDGKTLEEIFDNPYTFKITSLAKDDIEKVLKKKLVSGDKLTDINELFIIGQKYYLASAYDCDNLWHIFSKAAFISATNDSILGIRPVVYLRPEVTTIGKDENGIWQI